jgi:hypothetical protein
MEVWYEVYFTLLFVHLTLLLVWVFVLYSNLILKNHILQQLKKSKFKLKAKTIKILAYILSIHQTWDW